MEIEWVRIYLEQHHFQTALGASAEEPRRRGGAVPPARIQFSRVGQEAEEVGKVPFFLFTRELSRLHKGVVLVRSWTDWSTRLVRLRTNRDTFAAVEKSLKKPADLGEPVAGEGVRILVIPGTPASEPWRSRLREHLEAMGVDGVLSLRSILQELSQALEAGRQQSLPGVGPAMDLLRCLKFYDFLKDPQLELFGGGSGN